MDTHDWDRLWKRITDLWPNAAQGGEERKASFRRVCASATTDQIERAIRKMDEELKFTPKPVDLRQALGGLNHHQGHPVEKSLPSWPDLIRQQMGGCTGLIEERFAAMSDDFVQAWYHGAMVIKAHKCYCRRGRKPGEPECGFCDDHPEVQRHVALREKFKAVVESEHPAPF